MTPIERCGLPYDHYGDWLECRLTYNHDGNCPDANHAALLATLEFNAGLTDRTRQAQGPWL